MKRKPLELDDKLIYRYRPIDHVLGNLTGEVRQRIIRLSPPSELNDPMEGFQYTEWTGDYFLWDKLIEHYISCLCYNLYKLSFEKFLSDSDDSLELSLNIDLDLELQVIVEECLTKIRLGQNFRNLIGFLQISEKPLLNEEMASYFYLFHVIWIKYVLDIFSRKGIKSVNRVDIDNINRVQGLMLKLLGQSNNDRIGRFVVFQEIRHFIEVDILQIYSIVFKGTRKINRINFNAIKFNAYFPLLYFRDLPKLVLPNWVTASFSSNPANFAMWGYYAKNHTGCCLIYEPKVVEGRKFLTLQEVDVKEGIKIKEEYRDFEIKKVKYKKRHSSTDFFDNLFSYADNTTKGYWTSGAPSERKFKPTAQSSGKRLDDKKSAVMANHVLQKLPDWCHENEYRIAAIDSDLSQSNAKGRFFQCAPEQLKGMVFGLNTAHSDKVKALNYAVDRINNRKDLPFSFFQARLSPISGKISIDEIEMPVAVDNLKTDLTPAPKPQ